MNIENAFEIIENNIESSDFCGPISAGKVSSAEEILGLKFPKSYSMFLEKYGAGDIAGIELFGIIKDPATDSQMIPNGIWLTLNLREESNLPQELVVVSETGYGPYYVIDTSLKDNNLESPVYIWDIGDQRERVSDTFGEFLSSLLAESI